MSTRCAGFFKKRFYIFTPFLLFSVLCTIIFVVKSSTGPAAVFASQEVTNDGNQPAADAEDQPEQKQEKKAPRPEHSHPVFGQRSDERAKMVAVQISQRGVRDPNVLRSLGTVPRHAFVRAGDLRRAYADHPIPIGLGQTISQPYIVAYMTEALKLRPQNKVLEIGTGSGYQAAICAEIAEHVYTIEILEELAESAKQRLKKLGYRNVTVKAADGYFGWKEKGPFDAIIVTCAAGFIPPPLTGQLKPGGRMILPVGSPFGYQSLVMVTKDNKGKVRSERLLPVRFVPMIGQIRR